MGARRALTLTTKQARALRVLARDGECSVLRTHAELGERRDAVPVLRQLVRKGLATYQGFDSYEITDAGRTALKDRGETEL